jgi:hypothetical protein
MSLVVPVFAVYCFSYSAFPFATVIMNKTKQMCTIHKEVFMDTYRYQYANRLSWACRVLSELSALSDVAVKGSFTLHCPKSIFNA